MSDNNSREDRFLIACDNGDYKYVKDMQPLISLDDNQIYNAFYYAVNEGHLKIFNFLHEVYPELSKYYNEYINAAAIEGHLDIIKRIHSLGGDIHWNENQAFINSARNGHLDILKYFVENGANIHSKKDEALKLSAKNSYIEQIDYLLSKGGNKEIIIEYASLKVKAWLAALELNEKLPNKNSSREIPKRKI